MKIDPTGYFNKSEFLCGCGQCGLGFESVSARSFNRLLSARVIAGIPFKINSSIRCEQHNLAVGGKPDSAHLTGNAFDIKATTSKARFLILKSAIEAGFTRIGIYKTFIHIDDDSSKPSEATWL